MLPRRGWLDCGRRAAGLILLVLVCATSQVTPAVAQTPRRVLYLHHVGPGAFAHESRVHAGQVLAAIGQTSGSYTLAATDDVNVLNDATLALYDAVVFFTAGELPINNAQKAALLAFVAGGKGFVGVHSATDTFYTWPEYGAMIGGYFVNHPWVNVPGAVLRVEDRAHPATAHFGASVNWVDELYEFRNWSRSNLHVLLSLDTTSVNAALGSRTDNDYALAWTRPYFSGRVFYSALGHDTARWDDPRFQRHMFGGMLWALGIDVDDDGLSNSWETGYGLNPNNASGEDGPDGDPDGDGQTNAQEQLAGTHPRGFYKRYLAEGAVNAFFDVRLALLNVGSAPAHVQLRYLQPGGAVLTRNEMLAPGVRRTIGRGDLTGLTSPDFSTLIDSDQPIVLDRTMSWGEDGYGSHAETGVASPSTEWFLAEGATGGDFSLFYLLQNPNLTATTATVRYLLPGGAPPIVRTYPLAPQSRTTILVDEQTAALANSDVSAHITTPTGQPIIVERAMYRSTASQPFAAGHGSSGVTAPNTRWFLAEGATGGFFDLFILIANPGVTNAQVRVTYLLTSGGPLTKEYVVPAASRFTIWVNEEVFPGNVKPLATVSTSAIVESINSVPIVVERTMWWPRPTFSSPFWTEAHNSPGATQTGTRWALAEGEAGGPHGAETYVLIANTTALYGLARVTLYFENGESADRDVQLAPNSRTTVGVSASFPEAANRRFAAVVESRSHAPQGAPPQIVVERAMYTSPGGVAWAAGANALATRLQ